MKLPRTAFFPHLHLIVATTALVGCTDGPETTSSIESHGMLNGMLNGIVYTQGVEAFLRDECPLLAQRLLEDGGLTDPFPAEFADEIAKRECEQFMFYAVEVMYPKDTVLTLTAGGEPVASFEGVMNLQYLVAQADPQYTFEEDAFVPTIAQVMVTPVFAALTNASTRTVSIMTDVPQLDAHRTSEENFWYRENTLLVPATPQAITAMQNEPGFVDGLPNIFKRCDLDKINVGWLQQQASCTDAPSLVACEAQSFAPLPEGHCPLSVAVLSGAPPPSGGTTAPARTCTIQKSGEPIPVGYSLVNGILVPEEGCPQVYYEGHVAGEIIYDDRALNPAGSPDGCDFLGPSSVDVADCYFDINQDGQQISFDRIAPWRFSVKPIPQ